MELNEILSKVDHTLLAQTATWAEIKAICDDGMKYHTASVCIPASYVKHAADVTDHNAYRSNPGIHCCIFQMKAGGIIY